MNILVPDSWLREYLKTKATPKQIKEYLSLCGPSVERVEKVGDEEVYTIEVTSNRPDSMSVVGIAREAAAILPRFGLAATLVNNPYAGKVRPFQAKNFTRTLTIKTDPVLNPRWTSIVIDNVTVKPSPAWLQKKLELTGIRSLNTVIDITNYLMRAYGQPAHAFDYDEVKAKNGVPTMILRASKKGEKITTLDGKDRILPGKDIVIEDGSGRLIDLCGVMGAQNSAIKESTKTVILFLQTYDPTHIRKTMMALAHRTEAGGLFEKGTDPQLVLPAFIKGVELISRLSGGNIASKLYDIYPKPYKPYTVSVSRTTTDAYIGKHLADKEITEILKPHGFQTKVTKEIITVTVPSFRRDITIDVDIIEELARLYGYHNIAPTLPDTAPPMTGQDPVTTWEEKIKVRLRDWGSTEAYTYSMISEKQMDTFGLDKEKAYKITNPLSSEWVYMRPSLWPSLLSAVKQNLHIQGDLCLFELSMVYEWRTGDLPAEEPILLVAVNGEKFPEVKGIAEAIFSVFGIPFPSTPDVNSSLDWYHPNRHLSLGRYGSMGEVSPALLSTLGIPTPVTILDLNFRTLVADAHPANQYRPIPKYPPVVEDLSFVVPERFALGPLIEALKRVHPLVSDVTLLDIHKNTRTLHITYQDPNRNLTSEEIVPIRQKLITCAEDKFDVTLKTTEV